VVLERIEEMVVEGVRAEMKAPTNILYVMVQAELERNIWKHLFEGHR
jgi:hypothetical protein